VLISVPCFISPAASKRYCELNIRPLGLQTNRPFRLAAFGHVIYQIGVHLIRDLIAVKQTSRAAAILCSRAV